MAIICNKYKLLEKIGDGSFGTIYKGANIRTQEFVAIKIEPIINNTKLLKNETIIYQYLNNNDNQDIFINYNQNISFKGFYLNNYEIHIFFDLTKCVLRFDNIYRKTQMWYCLIDEIINHNKICNFCTKIASYSDIENKSYCWFHRSQYE